MGKVKEYYFDILRGLCNEPNHPDSEMKENYDKPAKKQGSRNLYNSSFGCFVYDVCHEDV